MDDGPRDQLGEERDEQQIFRKWRWRHFVLIAIHQLGDFLKGKE